MRNGVFCDSEGRSPPTEITYYEIPEKIRPKIQVGIALVLSSKVKHNYKRGSRAKNSVG